jgi:cytoskeletal protein CcmA (bactofilin family)
MAVEKEQKLSEMATTGTAPAVESTTLDGTDTSSAEAEAAKSTSKPEKKRRGPHISKYLLAFIILMVMMLLVGAFVFTQAKSKINATKITSKSDLSKEVGDNLKNTSQELGDAKQNLTISANTQFNNKVLVRGDLDVAGTIKVGSSLNLPGIAVAGTSTFDTINVAKTLTTAGDVNVQGQLVAKNGATFGGDLTVNGTLKASKIIVDNLEYRQALILQKPLSTTGSILNISSGGAAGAGGTVAVSGNQISGSLSVNTGAGTTVGLLATITFKEPLSTVPKVLLTPASAGAGQTDYYVSRTTSGFTINSSTPPPASSALIFDYFVVQ